MFIVDISLFTIHYSLFTIHYSLFTFHFFKYQFRCIIGGFLVAEPFLYFGIAREHGFAIGALEDFLQLATDILDGSVPFEEALKRAREKLDAMDLETLSKPLEEALEEAMFDKAAEAVSKERKTK